MLFGRESSGPAYTDAFRSIKHVDDNNNGILQPSDGYIVAGFSNRPANSGAGLHNGYIAKIDVGNRGLNPTQGWGFTYGHSGEDYFMDIIQLDEDSDGFHDDGYLAAGFTNSTFGQTFPLGLGGYNILLTKVDELGNEVWSKLYGTDDDDVAYTVIQTDDDFDGQNDDGFIVVGATGSIVFTETMEIDDAHMGSSTEFYVLKIASDGSVEWSYKIAQGDDAAAYSVVQADDYAFVVGGESRLANDDLQATMLKISQCGDEIVWARHYPDDPTQAGGVDHAREVIQKSDGGYALFGSTCSYSGAGGSAPKGDFYLIKTDCRGDVCLSGALNLTLINPGTLTRTVDAIDSNGPDDIEGDPVLLSSRRRLRNMSW